jgi:galactose mutarotase-like enzyme
MRGTRNNGSTYAHDGVYSGLRVIEASNGVLALSLLPELGAKIRSLRDLRNEREWLWTSDRIPLARHLYGTSYIERGDTGGWDECFPTVAPCTYPLDPLRGLRMPDHGDLWMQPWTTQMHQHAGRLEIVASCKAVALPCEFTRTITVPDDGAYIVLDYEARNTGEAEFAFIWSAHPLFRLEPGMQLHFPGRARFNVYSTADSTRIPDKRDVQWPLVVENVLRSRRVRLDPLPDANAGIAFKIWSEVLDEGWAALAASDGTLRMEFNVQEIPQIALWLNAGGWSGIGGDPYCNLALEPCIGAQDSLEEAIVRHGQYATLRAGEARRWSLRVKLDAYVARRAGD